MKLIINKWLFTHRRVTPHTKQRWTWQRLRINISMGGCEQNWTGRITKMYR